MCVILQSVHTGCGLYTNTYPLANVSSEEKKSAQKEVMRITFPRVDKIIAEKNKAFHMTGTFSHDKP